jgi:OMF family outer membrane factor
MRRMKKKLIVITGLFISGINSSWANNITTIHSESTQIRPLNKYSSQAQQNIVYELNNPNNLSLPSSSREVLVKTYQKIKIEELEKIILNNNPTIKIYIEKIDQSKSLLKNSLSFWYPTLNLTANGFPQYFESNNYNEANSISDTSSKQWSSSISAKIQWDLINPARIPEIASAKDSFEKAKYSYSIIMKDIKLEAKKRYFNLQRANEEIEVAKKSIESSSLGLRDAEIRLESGIGTKLEILEAKTQLARDQQLLNTKVAEQKIGQRALAEILNLHEDVTPLIGSQTKLIGIWDTTLEESIIAAYNMREELNNILLDISISNNDANSALAAGKPKISIVNTFTSTFNKGELNQISPNINNESSSFSNTIGLNASWYIFDGGNSKSLYKFNKSKSEEAKLNFSKKRAQIRKEVEEVFFKLESAKLNISASYSGVLSSRESLRLAKLRYKSGIATQREVVNNQRDLTDSNVRYIVAITNYNILLAELSRKTGLDNIKPCDIKVNEANPQNQEKTSKFSETNLIPLCQL